jgi:hypothetical protein
MKGAPFACISLLIALLVSGFKFATNTLDHGNETNTLRVAVETKSEQVEHSQVGRPKSVNTGRQRREACIKRAILLQVEQFASNKQRFVNRKFGLS